MVHIFRKGILSFVFTVFVIVVYSQTFTGKPNYEITAKRNGNSIGTITLELFPNIAPLHVRNFDSLVQSKFFDSTAFHRVIPGFMIQGGDPNSRHGDKSTWGFGDPNQPTVNAEFSAAKHLRGTLSAARDNDTNSATSQFFICVAPASWLNGNYSVYGRVTKGMEIADSIVNSSRDLSDNPLEKIEMFITYQGSNDSVPLAPTLLSPGSGTQNVAGSKLLKWNAVSDAIVYQLDVAFDSQFNSLFKTIHVSGISSNVTGLKTATNYYWRVRTNNGGHYSEYSDTWNFATTGSTGTLELEPSITNIQVFPNPSSGMVQLQNVGIGSHVFMYDIHGRVVFSEVSKEMHLNAQFSDFTKGIYFIKIIQQDHILDHRRFILE